LALLQEIIGIY